MREIFGKKIIGSTGPAGPPGVSGPRGVGGPVCSGVSGVSAYSAYSGFSGVAGFSYYAGHPAGGFSGYSRSSPPLPSCGACSSCHGFSGTAPDTARFTFTVGDKDWTDVCMFIKEGFEVEASPGEILWQAEGKQDPLVGRKMTDSVMLALIVKEDRTGEIRITVSDGSTYDVTRKSLAYAPDVPGKPHPGYEHDDGLLWASTPLGGFEAKLKVEKTKVTVRDFSLAIPEDAGYIMYYDGYHLMYFEAEHPFGCDETERGLAHDAAFAAVVEAEWRRKCAYGGREAHCQCEDCKIAEDWQKFYEATINTKPKPTPDA